MQQLQTSFINKSDSKSSGENYTGETMDHIKANNLISCHQRGFQEKRSCTTQLIECLSDWLSAINQKTSVDCIYLDFSKALFSY